MKCRTRKNMTRGYPPSPFASIGTIIGCKIASSSILGKTKKFITKAVTIADKLRLQRYEKVSKVKATSDILDDSKVIVVGDNKNLNATQGKPSETKVNGYRRVIAKNKRSRKNKLDANDTTTPVPKESTEHKSKGFKRKTEKRFECDEQPNKQESRPKSFVTVVSPPKPCKPVGESTLNKSILTTPQIDTGDVAKEQKRKRSSSSRNRKKKSKQINSLLCSRTDKSEDKQSRAQPESYNDILVNESVVGCSTNSTSPKVRKEVLKTKSPLKVAIKKIGTKRIWADVVAGTSKKVNSITQDTDKEDVTSENKDANEKKGKVEVIAKESNIGSKYRKNITHGMSGSSAGLIHIDQNNNPMTVTIDETNYLDHFPSLDEQKNKYSKKEILQHQQLEKNPYINFKTKRKKMNRPGSDSNNYVDLYKARKRDRKKRNKNGKLPSEASIARSKRNMQATRIGTGCSTSDSFYVIDNMAEVVIQPVSRILPLHQLEIMKDVAVLATDSCHRSIVSSLQCQNSKMDICNQLDAMSVDSSSGSTKPSTSKAKSKKPIFSQKSPKIRAQNEVGKNILHKQGTPPKKISKRYRALLRRDYDKVGPKTATEILNRGRWIDNHQKDKIYDRSDCFQQNRNSKRLYDISCSERIGDSASGPSRDAEPENTFFYCTRQNNECPTM